MGLMARLKPHMRLIERIMGLLLVAVGLALITGVFTDMSFFLLENLPFLGSLG